MRTSRKKLLEIEDEEEGEEGTGAEDDGGGDEDDLEGEPGNEEAPSESEVDEGIERQAEEEIEKREGRRQAVSPITKRKSQVESQATDDLTSMLQKTREDDLRKGKAVMRQMVSADH